MAKKRLTIKNHDLFLGSGKSPTLRLYKDGHGEYFVETNGGDAYYDYIIPVGAFIVYAKYLEKYLKDFREEDE